MVLRGLELRAGHAVLSNRSLMYVRFVAIADILLNFIPETLHHLTNFRRWYLHSSIRSRASAIDGPPASASMRHHDEIRIVSGLIANAVVGYDK